VFHIGFFKQTLAVLSCTCKACSRVLLDETEAVKYLRKFRRWAPSGAPIHMTKAGYSPLLGHLFPPRACSRAAWRFERTQYMTP